MIVYLTYNDQPSGVYWSQVTDVVAHLNTLGGPSVRLVALVSGRGFRATRRAIRARCPGAIVLPMVPTMRRWRANAATVALLCRVLRPTGILCRGPFATWMALRARERGLVRRVAFDGRGAYAAEWEEYRLVDDDRLVASVREVEGRAVRESDIRLAVSHALVAHWRERYGYVGDDHVVVPCTLAADWRTPTGEATHAAGTVRLVYSGSSAGWQSFGTLQRMLARWLEERPGGQVLFLSRSSPDIHALVERFPGRVEVKWLDHAEVARAMAGCDYGIMVRERTITNQVASPTKFAEYLACGLRVITNPGLGDLSAAVAEHDLGVLVDGGDLPDLPPVTAAQRAHSRRYVEAHFTKQVYNAAYGRLMAVLAGR